FAAQKARWAKAKGQKVVPIKAGKRRISPAGLARIRAAARARWRKVRGKEVSPRRKNELLAGFLSRPNPFNDPFRDCVECGSNATRTYGSIHFHLPRQLLASCAHRTATIEC